MSWVRGNGYWILNVQQKSEIWKDGRFGRGTMSQISAISQNERYPFKHITLEKAILKIVGQYEENHSKDALERMGHGVIHEEDARRWYSASTGKRVMEIGMAVPDFEWYLGASPDGVIMDDSGQIINSGPDNGIIEIKCPKKMYADLTRYQYQRKLQLSEFIDHGKIGQFERLYSHIKHYHYDQMQGCMAVMKKDWCDYIVYATDSKQIFIERIPFDPNYWWHDLFPRVKTVIEMAIKPLLTNSLRKPMFPPSYSNTEEISLGYEFPLGSSSMVTT